MALADAAFDAAMHAVFTTGDFLGRSDSRVRLAGAIKDYAHTAEVSVPGAGLVAPSGGVTGSTIVTLSWGDAVLESGFATLWGSDHSRAEARDLMIQAIQDYAATVTATVPAGGLMSPAGPVTGTASTGVPSFNDAGLVADVGAVWAQDNSAAFAAAALAAAIRNYFKSGTMPVPGTPAFIAPVPSGGTGPVSGTATGSVV